MQASLALLLLLVFFIHCSSATFNRRPTSAIWGDPSRPRLTSQATFPLVGAAARFADSEQQQQQQQQRPPQSPPYYDFDPPLEPSSFANAARHQRQLTQQRRLREFQQQYHEQRQKQIQLQQQQQVQQQQQQQQQQTLQAVTTHLSGPTPSNDQGQDIVANDVTAEETNRPSESHDEASTSLLLLSQSQDRKGKGKKRNRRRSGLAAQSGDEEEAEEVDSDQKEVPQGEGETSKQQRIRDITWNLEPRAFEEYEIAARLFRQCMTMTDDDGRCHFKPTPAEEYEMGKDGLKLYLALRAKYGYQRENAKRGRRKKPIMRPGQPLPSTDDEPSSSSRGGGGAHKKMSKTRSRSDEEKQIRTLRRKLYDIQSGRRKGTTFQRKDLAKVLSLTQYQAPKPAYEFLIDTMVQQAPTIRRHWHENVLKRYGEEEAWPSIKEADLARAQAWLDTFGTMNLDKKEAKKKKLKLKQAQRQSKS